MSQRPVQSKPDARALKGKIGLRRVINACGYSKDGLIAASDEAGFRQLLWLNAILFLFVLCLNFGMTTKMLLMVASMLTLIVELFNTAIEAAIDHTSLAHHPLAKRAKDTASAAQTLALLLLAALWSMALWRDYASFWF